MIEQKFHLVFFSLLVTVNCKLHRCTEFDEYCARKLATIHVFRGRQKCKVFNHTPTQRNVLPLTLQRIIRLPEPAAKYP